VHVLPDEILHDGPVLRGKLLPRQVAEQDLLLLAVMGPVCVGPEEIDGLLDEDYVDRLAVCDAVDLPAEKVHHLLDQPMLPHQGSDGFHGILLSKGLSGLSVLLGLFRPGKKAAISVAV